MKWLKDIRGSTSIVLGVLHDFNFICVPTPPNPEQLQSSWVTTMSPHFNQVLSPMVHRSSMQYLQYLSPESSLALIVSPRWCVPTMPAADILSLRYVTTSTIFLWCPLTIFTSTISTAAISMNCHALLATSYLFGGLIDRFYLNNLYKLSNWCLVITRVILIPMGQKFLGEVWHHCLWF